MKHVIWIIVGPEFQEDWLEKIGRVRLNLLQFLDTSLLRDVYTLGQHLILRYVLVWVYLSESILERFQAAIKCQ
jgi:hypothetical protein